ncbi:MAG: hypothetical protein OYM47_02755 [Gemmatimonadota bacterium]|nr:hypothetical protein [Gemmatimonadota bacterium]
MSADDTKDAKQRELIRFCRDLFNANVIAKDFDDVQVLPVAKRDFIQQPGGTGLHVTFSVSWHAIGKTGKDAHDALDAFTPKDGWD